MTHLALTCPVVAFTDPNEADAEKAEWEDAAEDRLTHSPAEICLGEPEKKRLSPSRQESPYNIDNFILMIPIISRDSSDKMFTKVSPNPPGCSES